MFSEIFFGMTLRDTFFRSNFLSLLSKFHFFTTKEFVKRITYSITNNTKLQKETNEYQINLKNIVLESPRNLTKVSFLC